MTKLTKNKKLALEKVDQKKSYTIEDATKLVKEISTTKFDASVDIDIRLGVDPRKANQMVRGVVTLPHGTGKQTRVLVLCTPDKEEEARKAGADHVGLDDYINKIRVESAKKLLLESDENLADIARQIGYQTDNSFIRVFKRYEGVTPGQYKKAAALGQTTLILEKTSDDQRKKNDD